MKKCLLIMLLLGAVAYGKDKTVPLPAQIAAAKTVYIDNQSGYASFGDRAYDALAQWGRFRVVDDPTMAELVFVLSASTYSGGTYTRGHVNQYGGITASTTPVEQGTTHLTIVDAKSGTILFRNQRDWGRWKSATKALIKDLRERMESR